ncbi:unnamed protein product [Notodromas monacha]|uniref:Small ribosomal subunit protein RACK1 n=1 Tax=Notodromas monacha TaxID=399045 RepID=A0A7R9GEZ1_9CRUS|nr:unnamed protein product [Notodromas monacha]CAG0920261.1 unnamed protein product [Notodromas monacha]
MYAGEYLSLLGTLRGHDGWVTQIATNPKYPDMVLSASRDKTLIMWKLTKDDRNYGVPQKRFRGHNHFVTDVVLSCDGHFALSGSWDKDLRLWDLTSGKTARRFEGHTKDVMSVAFSADNRQIVSGSRDKTIKLWNTLAQCKYTIGQNEECHNGWVSSVRFSPSQAKPLIVSGSWDKTIKVWNLTNCRLKNTQCGHQGYVNYVAVSPDGSLCASGGKDMKAMLWDLNDDKLLYTLDHSEIVNALCFSPNRYWLCVAAGPVIRIWDLEAKKIAHELKLDVISGSKNVPSPECLSLSWASDGQTLFAGYSDNLIRRNRTSKPLSSCRGFVIPPIANSRILCETPKRHLRTSFFGTMAATSAQPVFSLGPHTLTVRMSLHEANRQRLAQKLRENPECAKGLVVLQGGGTEDHLRYSTDAGEAFRQESYFHWAFGVLDPDWYGAVDVDTGKSYLFMPKLHESYAIWDGRIKTPEEFKKRYGVDEVYYLEDMTKVFKSLGASKLLTLNGCNSDSGNWTKEAVYQGCGGEFKVDNQLLFPVLSEVRVRKTEEELDVLRFAARVSADAHVEVMKLARPGMMEYQLEAIFKHFVFFFGGMRHVAYTCICGSGPNGAVLHYGGANAPNDKASINVLISFIEGKPSMSKKGKKKEEKASILKRPVICICNDAYAPSLKALKQHALIVNFPPTTSHRLAQRMMKIVKAHKLRSDMTTLMLLCDKAENDIRSCLSTLEFLCTRKRDAYVRMSDIRQAAVGQKDSHKSLFSIWQDIFHTPRPKKHLPGSEKPDGGSESVADTKMDTSMKSRFQNVLWAVQSFGDYEKVAQGVYENFLSVPFKDGNMRSVCAGMDRLCFSDRIVNVVQSTQSYSMLPYLNYTLVLFHFLFSTYSWSKITYPHLGFDAFVAGTKIKNVLESIASDAPVHVRRWWSTDTLVLDILPCLADIIQPTLRPVNTHLYTPQEKAELKRVVDIMIEFNLSYHQERQVDGQYAYQLAP